MILQIQRDLREDGFTVPMTKLCRWFDVPRRTVYYRSVKAKPKVQDGFAVPIKQMIEAEPSFGYPTVASLLRFNKNTVQRVFQLMGWQLSRSGKATTATAALERALIAHFGSLGRVDRPFLLRSDNGLVFTSRAYTRMVRS